MTTPFNPLEAAARNYLANTTGATPDQVDAMMLDGDKFIEMAASTLAGPYASFIPFTVDTDEARDGYVQALRETISHIGMLTVAVPSREIGDAVVQVLTMLQDEIQQRIDEVTQPTLPLFDGPVAEADPLTELRDLFKLFGLDVTVTKTAA